MNDCKSFIGALFLLFAITTPDLFAETSKEQWWYKKIIFGIQTKCRQTEFTPQSAGQLSEFKPILERYEAQIKSPKIPAATKKFAILVKPRCSPVSTKISNDLFLIHCFSSSFRVSDDLFFLMSKDQGLCNKDVVDQDFDMPESFHFGTWFRVLSGSSHGLKESAANKLRDNPDFFLQSINCLVKYSRAKRLVQSGDFHSARDDAFSECGLSDTPSRAYRQACSQLVAKHVAFGGTKSAVEMDLSWPEPDCECKSLRTKNPVNDREVCVCSRPESRCQGQFSVESYSINPGGGSSPWKNDNRVPKESVKFVLPETDLLRSHNVLIFELDKENFVALVLSHKFAKEDKKSFRPMLIFGSLGNKKVAIGYQSKLSYTDLPEDYEVRTNSVKKSVQLFRKNRLEWSGVFNLSGIAKTDGQSSLAETKLKAPGLVKESAKKQAKGVSPFDRNFTETEISQFVRTSYRTQIVMNGFSSNVMTINQSGRHLAFVSIDRNAVSHIFLRDLDKQTTASISLPFKNASVVSLVLQGGWTAAIPSLGESRAAATRLYAAVVSPGGKGRSGIYRYELTPAGLKNPQLVMKGKFFGLGIDHKGQEIVAHVHGSKKAAFFVYALTMSGNLTLKHSTGSGLNDILGDPVFSRDRTKIFYSSVSKSGVGLFYVDNKPGASPTKFMDEIGPVSVAASGEDVFLSTKWTGQGSQLKTDGNIYSLDPQKKKLTLWLDCREVTCAAPTIDPMRNIAYFSVQTMENDGTSVGAICSNGGF